MLLSIPMSAMKVKLSTIIDFILTCCTRKDRDNDVLYKTISSTAVSLLSTHGAPHVNRHSVCTYVHTYSLLKGTEPLLLPYSMSNPRLNLALYPTSNVPL